MTATSSLEDDSIKPSMETSAPSRWPSRAKRRKDPIIVERGSKAHLGMITIGLIMAVGVITMGAGAGQFQQSQLTQVMIFAIAIVGLNIATGYTGLVSVGHSAFFGLGAYTTGILIVNYGWFPLQTIPVALVVCFIAGLIVGLPSIRIRGLYLAIVTLAFGVAFPEIINRFQSLTGGAFGLTIRMRQLAPPGWTGYGVNEEGKWLYWLSLVVLIVVMVVAHNLVRNRWGLALMATRDHEIAASSCGVNVAVVKTVAFGVSGALAGVGGSLFAMYLGSLVANDSFTLLLAISLLTGLVIGGEGTRFGPILGGLAVVYVPYYTSSWGQGESAAVIFGALLIILVFVAPEGITGAAFRLIHRWVRVVPRTPQPFVRPDQPSHLPLKKGTVA